MPKKILFISNGHGEDTVSGYMISEIRKRNLHVDLLSFPLVGQGNIYQHHHVQVITSSMDMPQHGFKRTNIFSMIYRLKEHYRFLKNIHQSKFLCSIDHIALAIAVGDAVPAFFALRMKIPFIFVGINKSHYYRYFGHRYFAWERAIMRKSLATFVRDKITFDALRKNGLTNVHYAGNPIMDFSDRSIHHEIKTDRRRIVLLPGSYEDVYLNITDLLGVLSCMPVMLSCNRPIEYVLAAPSHVNLEVLSTLYVPGWTFTSQGMSSNDPIGTWTSKTTTVPVCTRTFNNIILSCDLVIGVAGTANEQAAGAGKPVVSFVSRGVQYTRAFGKKQQDLLGGALIFVEGSSAAIARKVVQILESAEYYETMSLTGKERMGTPGGSEKIVDYIEEEINQLALNDTLAYKK